MKLFCFPWAGGHAVGYEPLRQGLIGSVEVIPVELPGRGKLLSQRPFSDLPVLVEWLLLELSPHLESPFAFWGHSMGAMVSFELAHALRRANLPQPIYLFLSAHRAPHLPKPYAATHLLPDEDLIDYLQLLGGSHNSVLAHKEMMEMILPTLRADLTALNEHVCTIQEPLAYPLIALGGTNDAHISHADLAAWQSYTTAHFRVCLFPGGHFYLQTGLAMLLPLLRQTLYENLETERHE